MTASCGGHGHSPECLCDVVITDVTPINYHFTEVEHAAIVARATGYKREDGGAKLADFLEALGGAWDATRRLADKDNDWLADLNAPALKCKVEAYLQDGHSILDMPDLVGESFDRIVAAITGCQPCLIWTWDNAQWLRFEAYLMTKTTHSPSDLAERFVGLSRQHECYALIKLYGKGLDGELAASKAARAAQLFDEHPKATAEELRQLLDAEGYTYTLDGVRKARQRWKFRKSKAILHSAASLAAAAVMCRLFANLLDVSSWAYRA